MYKRIWDRIFDFIDSKIFEKMVDWGFYFVLAGFVWMGSLHCYRMFHMH